MDNIIKKTDSNTVKNTVVENNNNSNISDNTSVSSVNQEKQTDNLQLKPQAITQSQVATKDKQNNISSSNSNIEKAMGRKTTLASVATEADETVSSVKIEAEIKEKVKAQTQTKINKVQFPKATEANVQPTRTEEVKLEAQKQASVESEEEPTLIVLNSYMANDKDEDKNVAEGSNVVADDNNSPSIDLSLKSSLNQAKETKANKKRKGGLFPSRGDAFYKLKMLFGLGMVGGFFGLIAVIGILFYFSLLVPDYRKLMDYRPHLITKVYASNGKLLSEYAKERRIYVDIDEIPNDVRNAFIAAEDANFYTHGGFDLKGIVRATLINTFTSRKQGASTITQQVAKTYLLSSERTYTRKIKELILARRIEKAFSKEKILELYLNRIYLGNGAYGVSAAAIAYFDKTLEELDSGQMAMLAGMPKAPSRYNPTRRPQEARWRRDVILSRMRNEGFITQAELEDEVKKGLGLKLRRLKNGSEAPHFSEHVRKYIANKYGNEELYKGGLAVFSTIDLEMQRHAENAVYRGLREYDRRHGYRGAIGRVNILINWQNRVKKIVGSWANLTVIGKPAVVLEIDNNSQFATIGLVNGTKGIMPLSELTWARKYIDADKRGTKIKKISDVLTVGDIILTKSLDKNTRKSKDVARLDTFANGEFKDSNFYSLEQKPKAQASLVALDVSTGAIRAMVGGLGSGTGFNRAVQAKRQAGSAFKPFVYSMALDNGYTPASTILDAPVVLRTGELDEKWKPHNYSEKVYGASTLRRGLEKSRNLMTIRLARSLGMSNIVNYVRKFGLTGDMQPDLSTALGSASVSLLELTSAYSVFPNQGRLVAPYFIETIQDSTGNNVYNHYKFCDDCVGEGINPKVEPPFIRSIGEQVIDPTTAYQVVDLLRGVVKRGTAWRARSVGHDAGAKTGTTNDYIDAWLVGFTPTLAIGVWVGFDQPQTMGRNETGSKASAPIWTYFATDALKNKPKASYPVPEGVTFVRIDSDTGKTPTKATKKTILEVFKIDPKTGKVDFGSRAKSKKGTSSGNSEEADLIEFYGVY